MFSTFSEFCTFGGYIAEVVPVSMQHEFFAGGNFLYSLCFLEKLFVFEPQSHMGEVA